jgi:hypothetical protein
MLGNFIMHFYDRRRKSQEWSEDTAKMQNGGRATIVFRGSGRGEVAGVVLAVFAICVLRLLSATSYQGRKRRL